MFLSHYLETKETFLRRGKVSLEEINKKFNIDPESIKEYEQELQEKKTVTAKNKGSSC